MVHRLKLVVLFATLVTLLMCYFHFRVELVFTLRYVLQSMRSSGPGISHGVSVGYLLLDVGDGNDVTLGNACASKKASLHIMMLLSRL